MEVRSVVAPYVMCVAGPVSISLVAAVSICDAATYRFGLAVKTRSDVVAEEVEYENVGGTFSLSFLSG